MSKKALIICVLLSMLVLAKCSWIDESSISVQEYYNYEYRDFIDSKDENTKVYTDFSNGCIINNVDVYKLSCNLIENSVCNSYKECINKESMNKELYERMRNAMLQGQKYIDGTLKYEIKSIKYINDKVEVEYLREIKYSVDSHTEKMENKPEAPMYLCMRYTDNKWVIEYYDYPKGHG